MGTFETLTNADMAARLENWEVDLAQRAAAEAQAEAAELRERLRLQSVAHVDEISALRHAGLDPVDTVVGMLREYPGLLDRVAALEVEKTATIEAWSDAEAANTVLAEKIEALVAAAETAAGQRDQAFANLNRLSRELDVAQSAIRARDGELKELRALNPQRLQKQVKKLQGRNAELLEMDTRNKAALKATRAELRDGRAELETVKRHNGELLAALDDACDMMQEGVIKDRLWEDEKWAIVGHADTPKKIFILYIPTGELRVYDRDAGLARPAAVPAHVKDQARGRLERYTMVDENLKPYRSEGGAV